MKKTHRMLIIFLCLLPIAKSEPGRLLVPSYVMCERNALTSYRGIVTNYQRERTLLMIELDTTQATHEKLSIQLNSDSERYINVFIDHHPMLLGHWPLIEDSRERIKSPSYVTIWLCMDNQVAPIINWQSPEE